MKQKGISPLIASVVLIAVTMAIAGFLSVWAMQTFSTQKERASYQAECIGSIQILNPAYNTNTSKVIFTLRNSNSALTFSKGLYALLIYQGGLQQSFNLREYGVPNPLPTAPVLVSLNTTTGIKPTKLQIISDDCTEYQPEANIP